MKTMLISFAFSTGLGNRTGIWDNVNMNHDDFVRPNWKHIIKMKYIKYKSSPCTNSVKSL